MSLADARIYGEECTKRIAPFWGTEHEREMLEMPRDVLANYLSIAFLDGMIRAHRNALKEQRLTFTERTIATVDKLMEKEAVR